METSKKMLKSLGNITQGYLAKSSITLLLVISVGIFATCALIYQFICRDGLWYDELCLAHNLIIRDFYGLFKPLDISQVSPIMFLLIEKLMLNLSPFNDSLTDYVLRIYPLCCGLGVVILYYPLIINITKSKIIALFAYALLVLNPVFIYYTSEVKQYICELFYAVLLLYFWSKPRNKWNLQQCLFMIFLATLGIWNSYTICFVILPIALWDGWELFRLCRYDVKSFLFTKQLRFYVLQYGVILLMLLGYYFVFLYNHPAQSYMKNFWQVYYDAFLTISNAITLIDKDIYFYYGKIPMVFFLLGFFSMFFLKNKFPVFLSGCLIGVHCFFSYLHVYPALERFIFYWMVVIPLLLSCLLYRLLRINKSLKKIIHINAVICTFIIVIIEISRISLPIYLYPNNEYPRSALEFISENYVSGETVLHHRFLLPNTYIEKYYLLNVDKSDLIPIKIENGEWLPVMEQQLKKSDKNKIWLLLPYNTVEEIRNDIDKYTTENDIPLSLDCKRFDFEWVCLIEHNIEHTDISVQDTNDLTNEY